MLKEKTHWDREEVAFKLAWVLVFWGFLEGTFVDFCLFVCVFILQFQEKVKFQQSTVSISS